MEDVIDLRDHPVYLEQYIEQRNRYSDLLLTRTVSREQTEKWLREDGVVVRCLVDGGTLEGTVILYLDRGGEVAFFARQPGRGVGPRLLGIIEESGREKGLIRMWAWVLCVNERARRVFQKCGYSEIGVTERVHVGMIYKGFFMTKPVGQVD